MLGKTSALITISSMIGPAETGWLDKRCCASSSSKHVQLYMEHMATHIIHRLDTPSQVSLKTAFNSVNCLAVIFLPNTCSFILER